MHWFGFCDAFACRRTHEAPVTPEQARIEIQRSVGKDGANRSADVVKVQNGLNQVSFASGGPQPLLAEDGICGPLTIGAITRFQRLQFPGKQPDGRIDPGQRTIARLNEVLGRATAPVPSQTAAFAAPPGAAETPVAWPIPALLNEAATMAPMALARVKNAIHRLSIVRAAYTVPNGIFTNARLKREADWHFKFHKAADPVGTIDKAVQVYQRMNAALTKYVTGSFPLFQLAAKRQKDAIAYAHLGGYHFMLHEHDKTGEQGAYIYIANERFKGLPVIIHELGHYCGGRLGSGAEINHRSSPHPKPHGGAKEDGVRNYLHMTPNDALCNVYSYQVYALPEMGYGPPDKGPI